MWVSSDMDLQLKEKKSANCLSFGLFLICLHLQLCHQYVLLFVSVCLVFLQPVAQRQSQFPSQMAHTNFMASSGLPPPQMLT